MRLMATAARAAAPVYAMRFRSFFLFAAIGEGLGRWVGGWVKGGEKKGFF